MGFLLNNKKIVEQTLFIVSLVMVAFFMAYSNLMFTTRDIVVVLFVHFSLFIVFLKSLHECDSKFKSWVIFLFGILTIVSAAYILLNIQDLQMRRWFNTTPDLVIGVILIATVFYAGILSFGKFVPVLVMAVMIYPFFGQYLPEPFTTTAYSFSKTIANLSIGLEQGVFASPTKVMLDYVFLFVVFGSILGATGVRDFFYELGKLLLGRLVSGPGLIAVLNSALVGSIVGSALANVTVTGAYTIPAMKKAGYTPEQAGAIEVAASNGGQILPPVMGIIAFAMAGFSGVPYLEIMKMAVIPALLYYLCVAVYAHLSALKNPALRNRTVEEQTVDFKVIKYKAASFIAPLALIVYLLAENYSVSFTAFWAIITTIVVSLAVPKTYRPKIKDLLDGFVEGGVSAAQIGTIAGVVGIMLTTFTGSGLGIKLSIGIETWSAGVLFFALLIIWAISVVLGMIGVAAVAYFTSAAFAVPILVELGVPYEVAHFFVVFPASFALMTPPVALVSIVAARIAGGNYLRTSMEAVQGALPAFILPFLFVYSPSLLMRVSPGTGEFWADIIAATVGLVAFQVGITGYFLTDLGLLEKVLSVVGGALLVLYLAFSTPIILILGFVAILAVGAIQVLKRKKNSNLQLQNN